ncbi:hypothetical protein PVAP13_7NG014085, partial [Panicum virgatum]
PPSSPGVGDRDAAAASKFAFRAPQNQRNSRFTAVKGVQEGKGMGAVTSQIQEQHPASQQRWRGLITSCRHRGVAGPTPEQIAPAGRLLHFSLYQYFLSPPPLPSRVLASSSKHTPLPLPTPSLTSPNPSSYPPRRARAGARGLGISCGAPV